MDNRAVLQRLDILQGSFEAAVKPSAQRGNGQRGISPAADPQLMTTVEGLKQSVASLLDQAGVERALSARHLLVCHAPLCIAAGLLNCRTSPP